MSTVTAPPLFSIDRQADGVAVTWSDGKASHFHSIWLRDNCRCERCGDPVIGRRTLRLTSLDLQVNAEQAALEDGRLSVSWSDGHSSTYSGDWLRKHAYDDSARQNRALTPKIWDGDYIENAASKGAIDTFTFGLAKEQAAEGIRVNCLRPGATMTELSVEWAKENPDWIDWVMEQVPLNRPAEVAEIAKAGLFLISPDSSYVTGVILDASGGWVIP
jgi:NAD(P)-dependent dehydrogenase (short-subunit alcohol dehydrogenase family)